MAEPFHNRGPGPVYSLSRSAVDMLFWGAVLVALGYLVGGKLTEPSMAPHSGMGRMVLMVGGCAVYGWLARSDLWRVALALMVLSLLQALMMAGGVAIYTFEIFGEQVRAADLVVKAKGLLLGVDFALVLVLVILLRAAHRESKAGFVLGVVFFGSAAGLCLMAPLVLPAKIWESLPRLAALADVAPWVGAVQVALVVFALIPLVKTHRMLRGHEGAGGEDDGVTQPDGSEGAGSED